MSQYNQYDRRMRTIDLKWSKKIKQFNEEIHGKSNANHTVKENKGNQRSRSSFSFLAKGRWWGDVGTHEQSRRKKRPQKDTIKDTIKKIKENVEEKSKGENQKKVEEEGKRQKAKD